MPGTVGAVPECGSTFFFAYFSQLLEVSVPFGTCQLLPLFYIGCQFLGSMAAARYVHCDLRPENIVFDPETLRLTVIDLEYMHNERRDDDPTSYLTPTFFTHPPEHDGSLNRHRHFYTDSWAVGVLYLLSVTNDSFCSATHLAPSRARCVVSCQELCVLRDLRTRFGWSI